MDEIFQKKDGSYFIVDYKTAKYTTGQDALMPIYEVQLNAYAYIGNRTQFNPVTGIGLVYYEPQTDLCEDDLSDAVKVNGFAMPFKANLHELELNPDILIPKLLKKAKGIIESTKIPKGTDGCKDCLAINELMELLL
jgi:PD-(D/E)XK nuclease superfamily